MCVFLSMCVCLSLCVCDASFRSSLAAKEIAILSKFNSYCCTDFPTYIYYINTIQSVWGIRFCFCFCFRVGCHTLMQWCMQATAYTRCCTRAIRSKTCFSFFWFPRCCCWFLFFGPFWLIAGFDRQATCLDFHFGPLSWLNFSLSHSHSRSRFLSLSRLGSLTLSRIQAGFVENLDWQTLKRATEPV